MGDWDHDAPEKPSLITCPKCGRTSYHPMDVNERFCGVCDQWHEDMK
jgi:ribosomal protein L37E